MIRKMLSLSVVAVALAGNVCISKSNGQPTMTNSAPSGGYTPNRNQPKAPPGATNWGKSVNGVSLSLFMTNRIVERGSSVSVSAVITNASRGAVYLETTATPADFDCLLTNGAGKVYHLIPPILLIRLHGMDTLEPREEIVRVLPVTFGNKIEPGDYILQATRGFKASTMGEEWITLVSNPLQVQIK